MIIKIAHTWADWLVENGANSEDHDVYVYGAECILNEILSDLLLILTAILFHKTTEVILWMLFFTPLRVHLGGIHAPSHFKCIVSSLLISFICIFTYPYIMNSSFMIGIILGISFFIVYKIAPVVHPNHPVSKDRMIKMRKMSLFIVTLEIVLTFILHFYFSKEFSGVAAVSILSVCILAFFGKYLNEKLN